MAKTTRVHQLAKELGVSSKDIIAKCVAESIPNIENHMSTVSVGLADTVRQWFSGGDGGVATAVETAAPVDVASARAKVRKKAARKTRAGETVEPVAEPEETDVTVEHVVEASSAPERAIESQPVVEAPLEVPTMVAPAEPVAAEVIETPAPASRRTRRFEKVVPLPVPRVVMNVPERPKVVKPVGPMLAEPTKVKLSGPTVIRVEAPEVIPTPKARTERRANGAPAMPRSGPRGGRGAGSGFAPEAGEEAGEARGPRGKGATGRNKRRAPTVETKRSARGFADVDKQFNWRQQDLLEREERLTRAGGFLRTHRRDSQRRAQGPAQRSMAAQTGGKVAVAEPITIKNLSAATGIKAADILKRLVLAGKMLTVNSAIDTASATEVMLEFGIELEVQAQQTAEAMIQQKFADRTMHDERLRPPVVTILGHVDHGKTSLLDRIRNTNVAAGEAGGITQATSAFRVPVKAGESERVIVFLDTPGHEAFTEMRARGARVTDVVVLVVAADDGVMPQTIESINHAKAAAVPIVIALNKIDKPEATEENIQRTFGQLAAHGLNPAPWGGDVEVIRTSALKGEGIQELLDILDYQAQLREWKADFAGPAEGSVIEAQLEEGRGPVARLLVQQGDLKKGDFVVVGRGFGRVRDIVNDRGERVDSAGPSTPVAISGLDELPDAGDRFYVVDSLRSAEQSALDRRRLERERDLAQPRVTLDNIFARMAEGDRKEVRLIVKADVQGSVETLRKTLGEMKVDEVSVSVLHAAVGGINESDVSLAEASSAIIIGFNVTSSAKARQIADLKGIDIRLYDVIYDITDDVEKAAKGMLEPEHRLEVLGHAEVRQVFRISKVGMVAGCYVTDGVIERNSQIRVTRGGIVVEKDRRLEQLKRFKDDAREVKAGMECGMKIDGYDDIKEGDILECYKSVEVARA